MLIMQTRLGASRGIINLHATNPPSDSNNHLYWNMRTDLSTVVSGRFLQQGIPGFFFLFVPFCSHMWSQILWFQTSGSKDLSQLATCVYSSSHWWECVKLVWTQQILFHFVHTQFQQMRTPSCSKQAQKEIQRWRFATFVHLLKLPDVSSTEGMFRWMKKTQTENEKPR